MSMHRAGGRGGAAGRGRLVLLRGGRDARAPERDDADWQDFCARIGWAGADDLSHDDERLLVDRLLGSLDLTPSHDCTSTFDAPRPIHVARSAEIEAMDPTPWPVDAAEAGPFAWARRVLVASTVLAVAAAICFVVAATLSWQAHSSARVAQPEPERQHATPPRLRSIAPVEKIQHALEPGPTTPTVPNKPRKTPPAAPSETPAPHDAAPIPPGAVASTHQDGALAPAAHGDAAREEAHASRAPLRETAGAHPGARDARVMASNRAPAGGDAGHFSAASATDLTFTATSRRVLPVEAMALATRDTAWVPAIAEGVQATPARWSIAPAGDRWFGASLPPPLTGASLPGGIGVVAQLDIGKAIGQF